MPRARQQQAASKAQKQATQEKAQPVLTFTFESAGQPLRERRQRSNDKGIHVPALNMFVTQVTFALTPHI